jgi:hypothetical protein
MCRCRQCRCIAVTACQPGHSQVRTRMFVLIVRSQGWLAADVVKRECSAASSAAGRTALLVVSVSPAASVLETALAPCYSCTA